MLLQQAEAAESDCGGRRERERQEADLISYFIDFQKLDSDKTKT